MVRRRFTDIKLRSCSFLILYLFVLERYFLSVAALAFVSMSAAKFGRVVVVGSANQDMTSYCARQPVLGETVLGERFETSAGGKGANQANAASSVAENRVTMICRLGDDVFGQSLLQNFEKKGIKLDKETTVLKEQDISTGVATIIVDTKSGDNMIIVTPGANHELTPDQVRESLTAQLSSEDTDPSKTVVVVQLEILPEAALEAMKVAKEHGAMTLFNPAPAPEDFGLEDFYPYTDILIPNETELQMLCKGQEGDEVTLAKSLLNKGIGEAVICTLGARGAVVVKNGSEIYVAAPSDVPGQDQPVVDTIGAGDAFCGSLAAYLSSGGVESLERAAGMVGSVSSGKVSSPVNHLHFVRDPHLFSISY
jgi:ribokinase